ncbi:MAG: aldose epimerase family protein [Gammaproteobacteria bacterium]
MSSQVEIVSAAGLRARLSTLGAALHRLQVPTRDGPMDVVLRYPNAADYVHDDVYMGAVIGRFAGRIADGRLPLGGNVHQLNTQGEPNGHCLHGGAEGFHRREWASVTRDETCEMTYVSADGEQGFPGELTTRVRYAVHGMRLSVAFRATCTAPTVVNLTQHAYFNLSGEPTIDGHWVQIIADQYVPLRTDLIPAGNLNDVADTRFDLRSPVKLAMRFAAGIDSYDCYFVKRHNNSKQAVAQVIAPASGIGLSVYTTQPGLQFYSGHYLDDPFRPRQGLCLETQGFPDAPNQPAFPSALLLPGHTYEHTTVYEFSV